MDDLSVGVGPGDRPRVLVVQHEADCPPAHLGTWLEDAGCVLDVRHPYAGDALPDDLSGHDAVLVLGGPMGAYDDADHAWLAPTKGLLREAAEGGTPALGVCLGHQLATVALGGEVARNPAGQELGLLDVGWTDEAPSDPLLGALTAAVDGRARRSLQWNDDVVTRLPEGATLLARSPGGAVQTARLAPSVWGVQHHPEVDAEIVTRWASSDSERDPDLTGAALGALAEATEELERSWRPLADGLAGLARQHHDHALADAADQSHAVADSHAEGGRDR